MSTQLYLGLDCSTQSLSAVVISVSRTSASVVWEHEIPFETVLPEFGTIRGVLPSDDPQVAVAPPAMWARALELMCGALAQSGLDLTGLAAISGSAQQHGSVYLRADGTFSRPLSPIWMDSSTREECEDITEALGGATVLAQRTGSRAFERFTGPQIRRFFMSSPEAYADTARVHVVSSFLASRLIEGDAPLDPGDASGMNLMDLRTREWWRDAVCATAPGLEDRLPRIVSADSVIGTLGPTWQQTYGLPPARVVAWTGDNPSSLIGTGLVEEGRVAISLGTSDTIFGLMHEPRVSADGEGHVFGAPNGDYMGITVFKNGSLARERVRDMFGLDWTTFAGVLTATPPGNAGRLFFPWFDPEITPDVPQPGVHRVGLDESDMQGHVRGVIEAQMMAMANHSRWMGVDIRVIHATGGAAVNTTILQVMADVFGADVYSCAERNTACLGAALRAWQADASASSHPLSWGDVTRDLAQPPASHVVRPRADATALYEELRVRYAAQETRLRVRAI